MQIYWQEVGNARLRVASTIDRRDGTPLLIFNGIGASIDFLSPLVEQLPVPVLLFDMPGVGGSEQRLGSSCMSAYAQLAARCLNVNGLERVHVMGVSWGGFLAQEFALRYPHRVRKLILAATSPGQLSIPPTPDVILHMFTPLRYYSSRYFRSIAGAIYGGDLRRNSKLTQEVTERMTPPSAMGYMQQLSALVGWTSLPWLHRLEMETMVMSGTDDPVVPSANARLLADHLPSAEIRHFDCGHLFVLTRCNEVSGEIGEFLRR